MAEVQIIKPSIDAKHIENITKRTKKKKVCAYCRVSTDMEDQRTSYLSQINHYTDYIKKNKDWEFAGIYADDGITGTQIKKRDEFIRMIDDCKSGLIDIIIAKSISRFARNTVDTLNTVRMLRSLDIDVYFEKENIHTLTMDSEMFLTLYSAFAQAESESTSQNVKMGYRAKMKRGEPCGSIACYGFDWDKNTKELSINEKQAKIVRLIYQECLNGKGTTDIKFELERRGYKTSTGKTKWDPSYIVRILHNPFYCGTIVYRKSYVPDYLDHKIVINHGEVEQVVVEGRHTPLVSKEDFNTVQKILESHSLHINNSRKKGNVGVGIPKTVWGKKLKCQCGASFNKRRYHKATETKPESYGFQCYNQKNHGSYKQRVKRGLDTTDACDVPMIPEWKLKVMANKIFDDLIDNREEILKYANEIIEETIKDETIKTDIHEEITECENKINKILEKDKIIFEAFTERLISKEEFAEKRKEYSQEVESLKLKEEELRNKLGVSKDELIKRMEDLKKTLKDITSKQEELIDDNTIDRFVEMIEVHKDHFVWKFNFIDNIISLDVAKKKSSDDDLSVKKDKMTAEVGDCTSCN